MKKEFRIGHRHGDFRAVRYEKDHQYYVMECKGCGYQKKLKAAILKTNKRNKCYKCNDPKTKKEVDAALTEWYKNLKDL